jgi:hypothetical protein
MDGDGIPDDFDQRPGFDDRSLHNINPAGGANRLGLGGLANTMAASAIVAAEKRIEFEKKFGAIPKIGDPQVTKASGLPGVEHAARCENLARDIVARVGAENVKSITYNRELRASFPGMMDERRPDVTIELKNGDVILGEVTSGSQTRSSQQDKLESMQSSFKDRKVDTRADNTNAKDGPDPSSELGDRDDDWPGGNSPQR